MVFYKDNKILLTIGVAKQVVTKKKLAQNEKSFFGKIISIDLKTKDYQLVSMGHRNAQGLYYNNQDDLIISTEHGPRGGDEININKNPDNLIIENYGWPISSYGEHYDKNTKPALLNSHKDFGFQEPIKYYNPAIGISEIIKIPPEFNKKFTNDFFVGAMGRLSWEGDLSIHHIRFDKNFNKIIFEEIIPLEERVRDMIYLEEEKIVLMVLENTPSIGILKISNQ
jgi:glucose/arabinose dehydrogenase